MIFLLFDVAPTGGLIGAAGGVVFFLVMAAIAAFTFFFLKRSVKMAFRMAIVGVILVVAAIGAIAALYFGLSSERPRPRPGPPATRSR
jgi:hypothetical protein